ncbi:MAG TPA: DEAD/DEAH box helicase [Ktedonobacteraceae bacterium]|jgi:ATP-dependent Lhr-like helicase
MNTTDAAFSRLAPFIQSYIYQHGWTDLRAVQREAISTILDTGDHVLIMSGTASGKTEAAMLPVLTLLDRSPAQSVGVLYIGPLKALINDQFERIQALVRDRPDIPLQGWHGDIAQHRKKRFLQRPRGILQITPESLEAMLLNRPGELRTIFGDLRFIVIDEIHAFLGTARGQQVLCQLQRLERAIHRPVRRIGLSATIGDTDMTLRWLESGSRFQISARLVTEAAQGRRIELHVTHMVVASDAREFAATMAPTEQELAHQQGASPAATSGSPADETSEQRRELEQRREDYFDGLFTLTRRYQKTLIFTNRRGRAEQIAAELRQRLAREEPGRDWYVVHHSSIAADLREAAEAKMREVSQQACTIATASLELGIDIGQLDLTIQVDAPHTVSSFVQRLGRSGRRGTPSRMCFYTLEYLREMQVPQHLPWDFLQTLAIIQLYLEEQWIEPPTVPTLPLSLLYQQTMSIVCAHTELTPAQLAQSVLTLSPFQKITPDEYRLFLRNLVAHDHLAQMDEGTLVIGVRGGRMTSHYHFYAIFADQQDCQVFAGSQEIGTIQGLPEPESIIGLAGYAWRVLALDERRNIAHVERAKGLVRPTWSMPSNVQFHERVMQRLRQVLQEETMYAYLSPLARQRLRLAREQARQADWLRSCVVRLGPGHFALFPWTSSRIFETLVHLLHVCGWDVHRSGAGPSFEMHYDGDAGAVITELRNLSTQVPELIATLVSQLKDARLSQGKYDYLAPRALLEKAYINDALDVSATVRWLAHCF